LADLAQSKNTTRIFIVKNISLILVLQSIRSFFGTLFFEVQHLTMHKHPICALKTRNSFDSRRCALRCEPFILEFISRTLSRIKHQIDILMKNGMFEAFVSILKSKVIAKRTMRDAVESLDKCFTRYNVELKQERNFKNKCVERATDVGLPEALMNAVNDEQWSYGMERLTYDLLYRFWLKKDEE